MRIVPTGSAKRAAFRVTPMQLDEWFLDAVERGNPSTRIDARHADGRAWTEGNDGAVLIDGACYFKRLLQVLSATRAGDWVYFTDWQGDPDEQLDGPGTEVGTVLADLRVRGRERPRPALALAPRAHELR